MSDKNELVLPMLDNNYSNHEWNVAFTIKTLLPLKRTLHCTRFLIINNKIDN